MSISKDIIKQCLMNKQREMFYLHVDKEIDFLVPDAKLAIQASYSIKDQTTKDREIPPLVKYSKQHPDWQCFLISYDEETTEDGIDVIPVWKWLLS